MTTLFPYLFKIIVCSALLMGYYYLALRNKLFHQWNRFYLLATVFLSLLIPCFSFTLSHTPAETQSQVIQVLQVITVSAPFEKELSAVNASFWNTYGILLAYTFISFILLIGLLLSVFKIYRLIKSHDVQQHEKLCLILTTTKGTPFSFFRFLFWNPAIDITSEVGQQVFKHELVHIEEKHTVDKLFMQLVLIVCWVNPVFWLMRYELCMVHEFIADRKAVKNQDATVLAAMILQAAYPQHFSQLTNAFFHQSIKRRLNMLTKIQNPQRNYISRLLFLPLMAALTLAFTVRTKLPDATKYDKTDVNYISKATADTIPPIVLQSGVALTVAQLQNLPFAKLIQPDTDYTMISSTFSIGESGEKIYYVKVPGSEMPTMVKNLIDKARPNDMIFIENRLALTKDKKQVKLPGIFYYVK